jgi:hypothetical protein
MVCLFITDEEGDARGVLTKKHEQEQEEKCCPYQSVYHSRDTTGTLAPSALIVGHRIHDGIVVTCNMGPYEMVAAGLILTRSTLIISRLALAILALGGCRNAMAMGHTKVWPIWPKWPILQYCIWP